MATWKIDATHSEIGFKIKHLMITNVSGNFTSYDGTVTNEGEDFKDATIHFEADVDSINTKNEQRDGHLKSPDFFDTAKYPKLTFVSTKVQKLNDEEYKVTGNLTLHGETHPVELAVEYSGIVKDPYGQTKAGFEITGRLHRADFGLRYNGTTEAGGLLLSDEVKLNASIQLVKQ
ncbi:Polyisoprenoid-binding protein YceI [Chitinophaga costaii]|uniref:Polyisoprenoid-binding protein YceI n=1 Tax=Chitinophaga costaii TaxID=1335309 RepID=A0A1C4DRU2_9BACT|nr:YceI family protein [Chitinophaga costaii]PUZ27761.1 polyisoprenoid-binding protein [Chitinophaga costaii]SCC34057.1 Polyisoprenoid-binding protein YceI [Chitinophaga costaii]